LYYQKVAQERLTKLDIKRAAVKKNPTVDNYIGLSLEYYNAGQFDSCIWAANEILKLDPNNLAAYNNICAANNQLQNWDAAIAVGEEGLRINPDDQLLRNNLQVALDARQKTNDWSKMSAKELLDLSLKLYAKGDYQGCIDACEASLRKKPRNAVAYNNICSAYNAMHQWEKAIQAGTLAVEYAPDFKLAQNNLAYARKMLQENKK
jgi:tetratricopeptide (TPR) repeat protein